MMVGPITRYHAKSRHSLVSMQRPIVASRATGVPTLLRVALEPILVGSQVDGG